MGDSPADRPQHERDIDWGSASAQLRTRIRERLGRCDDATLQDLTQEALIHLVREVRHNGARSLTGLIVVIARSTAVNEIRRRKRRRARFADWEELVETVENLPEPERFEDFEEWELIWFLLLEYFRRRRAPCHALAVAFAEKGDWKAVAESVGQSHDAIRQQWSRCTRAFRDALRRDPGPFAEWLKDDG